MKILVVLLLQNQLLAQNFNENLTAVHYSIASAGIDSEIKPGNPNLDWNCVACTVSFQDGGSIEVSNPLTEIGNYQLTTNIVVSPSQNIRLTIHLIDYIANWIGDNSFAESSLEAYIDYGDGVHSPKSIINCRSDCMKGVYIGNIDVRNPSLQTGSYQLIINLYGLQHDVFKLDLISFGDLVLASQVFEESEGIITDSCDGKLTANVFFGKAGVGKSTVASWTSSLPGLFEVGTVGTGTTTLGTWLSNSIFENSYCKFAEIQFEPIEEIQFIPPSPDMSFCKNGTSNLAFFDTEGLDYQTELGNNYDIITVLPHTLIAENVFLVVNNRLNPNEVKELIDRLAEAAKKTNGFFTFRKNKLFGNLIIIVNKSQDILQSDEAALQSLIDNNPSLIIQIEQYFTGGPTVVLLPTLQWDYDDEPDFNEPGFYLNYDHISSAHPPRRDRMLYGLQKIAYLINSGISEEDSYFIQCDNFENLIRSIYNATTEEAIDIGDIDYEWQLTEASNKLEIFIKKFALYQIGLTDDVAEKVCPEANIELYGCIESTTDEYVQFFYQDCLDYIVEIFPRGRTDLKTILDDKYFPEYVTQPVNFWLHTCDRSRIIVEMYSDDFLTTFEKSDFFLSCKKTVEGKLSWNDWGKCSVSCGGGVKTKIASSCVPDFAICYGLQIYEEACNQVDCPIGQWGWNDWSDCTVSCGGGTRTRTPNSCIPENAICTDIPILEETCNQQSCPEGSWNWQEWGECTKSCGGGVRTRIPRSCQPANAICYDVPILEEGCNYQTCPDMPSTYFPAGTIISWVPRPNKNAPNNRYFNEDTWIECNGVETCKTGPFIGQTCSDLSNRVLVGAGSTGQLLDLKKASLPDHFHAHRHEGTGSVTDTRVKPPGRNTHKCSGMTSNRCQKGFDANTFSIIENLETVNFSQMDRADQAAQFTSKMAKTNSDVTFGDDLFSAHMRVLYFFKCH